MLFFFLNSQAVSFYWMQKPWEALLNPRYLRVEQSWPISGRVIAHKMFTLSSYRQRMEGIIVLTKPGTAGVSLLLKLANLSHHSCCFSWFLSPQGSWTLAPSCCSDNAPTYQLNWHGPTVSPSVWELYNEKNLAHTNVHAPPVYFETSQLRYVKPDEVRHSEVGRKLDWGHLAPGYTAV